MTIFLKRQISVEVSQTSSGRNPLFRRGDLPKRLSGLTSLEEGGLQKVAIPVPTVDLDLMIDGIVEGKVLYIETDTEITVKLETTSDTGFLVSPVDSENASLSLVPGTLYLETSFSHVYVSVSGTSGTANIVIGILGA
jgi:hypothetical protein